MSLQSKRQLENTRAKLKLLEDRIRDLDGEPAPNVRTRELTRHALKKLGQSIERRNPSFRSQLGGCKQVAMSFCRWSSGDFPPQPTLG
jgi:hypothetical protein